MPESMEFNKSDYPELEGLKDGASVRVILQGTKESEKGDMVTLNITRTDFETDNVADRELRDMTRQEGDERGGEREALGDEF